jgi:hypothetical protein
VGLQHRSIPTVIALASTVIPAKVGIQENGSLGWIPAKKTAGMTGEVHRL